MNILQAAANAVLLHGGALLGRLFRRSCQARGGRARRVSEKRLFRTLRGSRNTEYGKRYGFSSIRSVGEYQDRVPLSTYEDYRPYIERTAKNGEQRLITGHKINYFATTSGTVNAVKLIPQITESYIPYFKFICIVLDEMMAALRRRGVRRAVARGLLLTEVTMRPAEQFMQDGGKIRAGMISAYAAGGVKTFLPLFTPLPREIYGTTEIADMKYVKARYGLADRGLKWFGGVLMSTLTDVMTYIETNYELLIRDIETGTIDPSVEMTEAMRARLTKKLRPDPKRAAELREIFSTPSETPLINRLWPKMSFICSIGSADFEPFTKTMRTYCAPDVSFHYALYASSESAIGTALRSEEPTYLLFADAGFFEFLPVEEECAVLPERPLLPDELEVGKHYEIIVTNRAGLYRYQLRDVVLVTGYEGKTPYVRFAYRKDQVTNLGGMHLMNEEFSAAVDAMEEILGVPVTEFSIYSQTDRHPGRIVLFLELAGELPAEKRAGLSGLFDEKLQESAPIYKSHVLTRDVTAPVVVLLRQGTYMRWRDERIAAGASVNQLKAVRVIDTEEKLAYFRAASIRAEDVTDI